METERKIRKYIYFNMRQSISNARYGDVQNALFFAGKAKGLFEAYAELVPVKMWGHIAIRIEMTLRIANEARRKNPGSACVQ